MKRLVTEEHTVRCPLEDCAATVTVRSNPTAPPSRRHRDVTGCSLRPPASYVAAPAIGYFSDVAPPMCYLRESVSGPCYAREPACSKECLGILNAAEPGAGDPMESAQELAMRRLLWNYGG